MSQPRGTSDSPNEADALRSGAALLAEQASELRRIAVALALVEASTRWQSAAAHLLRTRLLGLARRAQQCAAGLDAAAGGLR